MNPIYQQLIDREQAKIVLLQGRIARHEERIATLRELAVEDEEECGAQVDPGSNAPSASLASPEVQGEQSDELRYPSRISRANLLLLQYIGTSGKSLNELEVFCTELDLGMKRKDITSFANVYRKRFGMLDSPAVSHYQLTERGKQFVSDREKDVTPIHQTESASPTEATATADHNDLA